MAVVALAACLPALPDDTLGALRHGKHVSRAVDPVPAVRTTRGMRSDPLTHRRGGSPAWGTGAASVSPASLPVPRHAVRWVHTLSAHWGSRHLLI